MVILFKNANLHHEMKRRMIIERLEVLGVSQNQYRELIYTLDYEELITILIIAEMRQVDIDHPDHKWFR